MFNLMNFYHEIKIAGLKYNEYQFFDDCFNIPLFNSMNLLKIKNYVGV